MLSTSLLNGVAWKLANPVGGDFHRLQVVVIISTASPGAEVTSIWGSGPKIFPFCLKVLLNYTGFLFRSRIVLARLTRVVLAACFDTNRNAGADQVF